MASLPSSIYDLIAGDPAAKEQDQFRALGDYSTGVGEGLTTAGSQEELGILSGDPTKIAQVEAPEITAQNKQIEQQRLQNANFGSRSGGTTASTAAAEAGGRANIIDLTGNLINNTAGAAVGQGTGLISQGSTDIGNEAQLAEERRKQVTGDIGGIAEGAGQIATGFIGDPVDPAPGPSAADIVGTPMANPQAGVGSEPSLGFDPNELDPTTGKADLSMFQ